MKAKRIFVSGAVAFGIVAMGSVAAGSASAQSVLRGSFHLEHQVQWADSRLEPGDYTIQLDSAAQPAHAFVGSADGKRLMVMARSTSDVQPGGSSLLLGSKNGQWVVLALNVPRAGVSLLFAESSVATRETPVAETTVSAK